VIDDADLLGVTAAVRAAGRMTRDQIAGLLGSPNAPRLLDVTMDRLGADVRFVVNGDTVTVDPEAYWPDETADDPRDELFEREAAHARAVAAEADRLRVRRDAQRVVRADDRPKTPEPTGRSLRDLLADPDEPAEYRIDGLMPTGARVLFAGAAKAGKTSTLQALLGALANGGLFLGRFAVEPPAGRIAYLDFELGERQARRWLHRAGVRDPDRIEFYDLKGREAHFDLRRSEVRTWWADELRSKGIGFPIFDCLTPVLRTLGIDENTEAATIAYGYSAMCTEAGIDESILAHHAGHGAERSRGDSALLGWSAVNWTQVRRTEGNRDDRFLVAEGRDVDLPESLLAFDLSTRVLTLVGGNRTETAADELIPDVLAWLTDNPASSGRSIEVALLDDDAGRGRQKVRTALSRSVQSGRVVRVPGPKNAQLHSVALSEQSRASEVSAPSAPAVRPRTESECASAPIGRTALTDEQEVLSAPRTQTGAQDVDPPWRRLLLAKDAAIAEGVITEDQVTPREYLVRYGVAA